MPVVLPPQEQVGTLRGKLIELFPLRQPFDGVSHDRYSRSIIV